MILTDSDIAARLDAGSLIVDPLGDDQIQPASVDLRLGTEFLVLDALPGDPDVIDPARDNSDRFRRVNVPHGDSLLVGHGRFALATTHERVQLPDDLAARWEGRSSIGRLGLATHVTAGFIDPGFTGHITLELANHTPFPIRLWPGMRIGQLCLIAVTRPALVPYGAAAAGSHYQGQTGPTASRIHERFTSFAHAPMESPA